MRRLLMAATLLCAVSTQAQTVLCESLGNAYRECQIGTSGTVQLIMERSENLCYEGLTWGTNRMGVVWVDRGCRATFKLTQPGARKGSGGRDRVVCESIDDSLQACPADTSGGVAFAQQLSKTTCVQDKNWGVDHDRQMVWVDRGCRAEFILGDAANVANPATPLDTPVICESANGKRVTCKADTSAGVQIVRQLDDSTCGYGREWGYDTNGIWVAKGCRAEFVVRGKPKVMVRSLVCESENNARHHCAAETQFGVAIFKRLDESNCVLGESWGFDETGVWVDAGCRAQFALGGYRLPAETMPPNASKLTCESLDGGHKPCPADTARGVGLLRQISDADCVLNRTWGYDRNGIWVTNGCRAEFAVAR